MKFRTPYTERLRVALDTGPDSRTQQEFLAETDINTIMAKYKRTGILPQSAKAAAMRYGDFSAVPTFQEMHDRVLAARELFSHLPAALRTRYGNDPGLFLDQVDTEEGKQLLIKLGLAERVKDPTPPASSPESNPSNAPGQGASGQV